MSILAFGAIATAALDAGAQPKGGSEDVYDDKVDPVDQASEQFNRGVELSRKGDVAGALDAFQKAFDLVPNWKILYNIGQTSQHIGDHARALRAFERYLAEGGTQVSKARHAEVERNIARLRPLVGQLEIAVNEPGARVEVDGVAVGVSPLTAKVPANPGRRRVTAHKDGGEVVSLDVVVEAGTTASVDLKLGGGAAGPAPSTTATGGAQRTPPGVGSDEGGGSALPTIAWIATGVLAAGAIATGTIALLESEDLADSTYAGPDTLPPPDSELRSQASRIDTLAMVTDVLAGAAILTGGAAIYLTIAGPPGATDRKGRSSPTTKTAARPLEPSAGVRVGPSGFVVEGRF